ncbi:uncharacterized protein [Rutidosis leptorrhynchoides]|uniref:uncharacterized protein n=1 Tax=Rutidosis leptorrhynchoides TaxID=125765 RepID=UPI003A9A0B88
MAKSTLYGIGVNAQDVENIAMALGCKSGSLPILYLGLTVGSKLKKLNDWKPVIDKFNTRLTGWKARSMSFGGRLILIKSVLSSLPLYFFSLYRAPTGIINLLESMRRKFFWGGAGDSSKMAWVKWDDILVPYESGGLNVGSLKAKNLALTSKWWWHFRVESGALTLFGRSEADRVHSLLASVSLNNGSPDTWKWALNDKGHSKTSIMASEMDEKLLQNGYQPSETVRNKLAPKKIEIFAWRAIRRRLPT